MRTHFCKGLVYLRNVENFSMTGVEYVGIKKKQGEVVKFEDETGGVACAIRE